MPTLEKMKEHHMRWHELSTDPNPAIKWHVPNQAEMEFVEEFVNEFLKPTLDQLEAVVAGHTQLDNNVETKVAMMKYFLVLSNFITGTTTVSVDKPIQHAVASKNEEFDDSLEDLVTGYGDNRYIEEPDQHIIVELTEENASQVTV
jgi:hypothetical protein